MEKLNILIFGAGAIGTYIGGSLALTGNRITFIEQPKVSNELARHGLRLELRKAEVRMMNAGSSFHTDDSVFIIPHSSFTVATSLAEALQHGTFDIAIFALKSFDTGSFLKSLAPLPTPMFPVLCLSNGVDNEPALEAVLGPENVIAGTVTSAIGRRTAGDIVLEKLRGVGVADRHPLSLWLAEAFCEAGLNAQLYRHAADMKWSKMLTNLPANASAAILNMTAAEVFAHPGLFALEMRMLRETLAVMKRLGIHVVDLPRVPVRALALAAHLPARIARPLLQKAVGGGRGGKMPSFHIDLHSGRGKSEVEWLNGAVVRYGKKAGIPTPVNSLLTETLLVLTRGEIPLETYSRQPEKLITGLS
jgi:2-dehydropantoate 2-reductase